MLLGGLVIAAFFQWLTAMRQRRAEAQRWAHVVDLASRTALRRIYAIAGAVAGFLGPYADEDITRGTLVETVGKVRSRLPEFWENLDDGSPDLWENLDEGWVEYYLHWTEGLIELIAPHVTAITDRVLPRVFELRHDHDLVEQLWDLENKWVQLTESVGFARQHTSEAWRHVDDLPANRTIRLVPTQLDRFLASCQRIATYFS